MKRWLSFGLFLCLTAGLLAGCSPEKPAPSGTVSEGTSSVVYTEDPDLEVTFQSGQYKVTAYGAVGDGTTDDTQAIRDTLLAAQQESPENTLYFSAGTYRIAGELTFPLSMQFVFEKGASLSLDASSRVTFEGSVVAGRWTVFAGEGEIAGMLNNPYVYPQWFGAKGDGQTDDTQAFRRAIGHANEVAIPYTTAGYVLNRIDMPKGKRVYGFNGKKAILIGHPDCEDMFVFHDKETDIKMYDLSLRMGQTGESSCFFFDSHNGQDLVQIELSRIETEGAYHVIRDAKADPSKVFISNIYLDGFVCRNSRSSAVDTDNFWGFCFMRNCVFDNSGLHEAYGIDGDYPAVIIGNNAGYILQNNRIIGTGNPGNTKEFGFQYKSNVATWMDGCTVTNTGGDAIHVSGGSHLYFSNITLTGMYGSGLSLSSNLYPQIHNITVTGRYEGQELGVKQHGIILSNSSLAQMNQLNVRNMYGHGVALLACDNTVSTKVTANDNALTGYYVANGVNLCTALTASGNGTNLRHNSDGSLVVGATLNGTVYEEIRDAASY